MNLKNIKMDLKKFIREVEKNQNNYIRLYYFVETKQTILYTKGIKELKEGVLEYNCYCDITDKITVSGISGLAMQKTVSNDVKVLDLHWEITFMTALKIVSNVNTTMRLYYLENNNSKMLDDRGLKSELLSITILKKNKQFCELRIDNLYYCAIQRMLNTENDYKYVINDIKELFSGE